MIGSAGVVWCLDTLLYNHKVTEGDFWARVEKSDGCWLYQGIANKYGSFSVHARGIPAHRYAWELAHGPIPPGLYVCHHCDTPGCVKTEGDANWPDGHLFLGTAQENSQDAAAKGRLGGKPGPRPGPTSLVVGGVRMKALPSSQFRLLYIQLTEPTVVTVNGHAIGTWLPTGFLVEARAEVADLKAGLGAENERLINEVAHLKRELASRPVVNVTTPPEVLPPFQVTNAIAGPQTATPRGVSVFGAPKPAPKTRTKR